MGGSSSFWSLMWTINYSEIDGGGGGTHCINQRVQLMGENEDQELRPEF